MYTVNFPQWDSIMILTELQLLKLGIFQWPFMDPMCRGINMDVIEIDRNLKVPFLSIKIYYDNHKKDLVLLMGCILI